MAANPNPLPDPNEELVRVFDAEQESEAMVVCGLLESKGIDCEITALDAPQDVLPIGGTSCGASSAVISQSRTFDSSKPVTTTPSESRSATNNGPSSALGSG